MVNYPFEALANPIRRTIVERLASGPRTVGEATAGLSVSKSAISRHVHVLEVAGVVKRTVQGRTHLLALNAEALEEAGEWLDRQRTIWGRLFDSAEDQVHATTGALVPARSATGTAVRTP